MKQQTLILTIAFLTTLYGCTDSQPSDKDIELKANNIVQLLDSNAIKIFKEWTYGIRGEAEIWTKQTWDSALYSCLYFKTDTARISTGVDGFKKEFPYEIIIDSSKYYRVDFVKINDSTIRITATNNHGEDNIITSSIPLRTLFKKRDPFKYFKTLSDFKDSLGIYGSSYRPDIGNFIQFYISNSQFVLTYLSDSLNLDPRFKDVWVKEFATGKTIKKNWNLRKLDKPLDNG